MYLKSSTTPRNCATGRLTDDPDRSAEISYYNCIAYTAGDTSF